MNKPLTLIAAALLALSANAAFAADAPKAAADSSKMATKLEKPASVSQADWDKMSDEEKKKAVEKAKSASAPAQKKPKKGGC